MADVLQHCELGPAVCLDCLEGQPPERPAPSTSPLLAERFITARVDSSCARFEHHRIYIGDRIGYVDEYGWCCDGCVR